MRYGKTYEARTLIWSALRRNPRFTVGQIQKLTTVPERTVYDYVRQLQAAGYVAEVTAYSAHEQIAGELELRSDTGPHAPRVVKGELLDPNLNPLHFDKRTRIWTLIRHMGRVDVDELSCATDGEQNPGDISRHLKFWADQGYLRVISRNRSGKAGEQIGREHV